MAKPLLAEIVSFYDANVSRKLRGFVEGNDRVERAWLTIDCWAPSNPCKVCEIGCGIGDICWRMTRKWPEAEVLGIDISPHSLQIANQLFSSSRLSFIQGPLVKGLVSHKCDLIVLMDLYEHIPVEDRAVLHEVLKDLRSDNGRIVLTFPTPHHQAWLRRDHPDELQPVDEDITIDTIRTLARDLESEVLLYEEVGVWHEGDYAHAVLGDRKQWLPTAQKRGSSTEILEIVRWLLATRMNPLISTRAQRLAMVRSKLGPQAFPL